MGPPLAQERRPCATTPAAWSQPASCRSYCSSRPSPPPPPGSPRSAAEWSQGTWRNLLVREPRRLSLLSGKMLALMLFVLLSMTLTLVGSSVLILTTAAAQGVQTAAWTSSAGLSAWLAFFDNEVLCLVGVCLLGMLIAVLTRSTGLAVGVALAYVLVPEYAEQVGLLALDPGAAGFEERVRQLTDGERFDVVFEATGSPSRARDFRPLAKEAH